MVSLRAAIAAFVLSAVPSLMGACNQDGVEMRLLVYDDDADAYVMDDVVLTTLDSVRSLDGEATVIKSGLSLLIDYREGNLEWRNEGHGVAFNAIRDGTVLVPDSYDSLAMASIYYSMELSYLFFRDGLGLGEGMPPRLPTHYAPEIEIVSADGERARELDNAFYMKVSDNERGFFVMPFDQFQWIPMALNSGILTHEYTHYIFDTLVLDNLVELDLAGTNFLGSVNEATSDFLAVVRTEDPDYMAHSVPQGLFVSPECNASREMELSRDISSPERRNYDRLMDTLARNTASAEYCPYEIGLFIAALLYEISVDIDVDRNMPVKGDGARPSKLTLVRVGKWWLNALGRLGLSMAAKSRFELWDIFSLLVDEIPLESERAIACRRIEARYGLYFSEVDGC